MRDPPREQWNSWLQSMSVSFGYIFGITSIWGFPYLCYIHGGVTFVIISIICHVIFGLPIMVVELWFSYKANLSPGAMWIVCPLLKGIGVGMVVYTAILSVYYNVFSSWSLYYLVNSFSSPLPWTTCDGYNSTTMICHQDNLSYYQYPTRSVDLFWQRHVNDGFTYAPPGMLRWQLVLSLMAAWVLVFLCLMKGIRIFGKISYILNVVIIVLLVTLTIRFARLHGVQHGLEYISRPGKRDFQSLEVWNTAFLDVLLTFGLGQGCLGTISSHKRFDRKCVRLGDATILIFASIVIKCLSTIFVFMTFGYLAEELNEPIEVVASSGSNLVFLLYTEALAKIPLPQLWTVLFFIMMLLICLSTQVVYVLTIISAVVDNFPRISPRKYLVVALACIVGFLLGLPCVTQHGFHVINLIDHFLHRMRLLILALELVAFACLYGTGRFNINRNFPTEQNVCKIIKIIICFVLPVFTFLTWIYNAAKYYGQNVANDYNQHPKWFNSVGWIIAVLPLLSIPCGMVYTFLREKGNPLQRFLNSLKPECSWKPRQRHYEHFIADQTSTNEENNEEMENFL